MIRCTYCNSTEEPEMVWLGDVGLEAASGPNLIVQIFGCRPCIDERKMAAAGGMLRLHDLLSRALVVGVRTPLHIEGRPT